MSTLPHTLDIARLRPETIVSKVPFGNFAESRSKDFDREVVNDEEPTEDYGYLSDSDLEDDEDEKAASPWQTGNKVRDSPARPVCGILARRRMLSSKNTRSALTRGKS